MRRKRQRPEDRDSEWTPRDWTFQSAVGAPRAAAVLPRRKGAKQATRREPSLGKPMQAVAAPARARAVGPLVLPTKAQARAMLPRFGGAVALAFWAWLLLYLFVSDAYYVDRVEVRGNSILSAERIAAQAELPAGYHILFIDPQELQARVLALPEVRAATVTCELPGRVTLHISERKPLYNWRAGGQLFWVDGEGVLMEATGPLERSLTVEEPVDRPRAAGERVDRQVIVALQKLERLLPSVQQYQFAPVAGLRFQTAEGVQVFLGMDDLERRVLVLQNLLRELEQQNKRPAEIHVEYRYPVVR